MPCSAPLPTPTIIAVGVASPKAQGQAIIRIPTKANMPNETAVEKPKKYVPKVNHKVKVNKAIIKTAGIKMAETLSARF